MHKIRVGSYPGFRGVTISLIGDNQSEEMVREIGDEVSSLNNV